MYCKDTKLCANFIIMATVFANSLFAAAELATSYNNVAPSATQCYKIPQIKLSYIRETSVRYEKSITDSGMFNKIFRPFFEDGEMDFHEVIFVAYTNRRNQVIGVQRIGTGSEGASVCDIKALFAGALLCRAAGFALCHNHPSGGLKPSAQDDRLTMRIKDIATFHELQFLDHLIITSESYYSYHDEGRYI